MKKNLLGNRNKIEKDFIFYPLEIKFFYNIYTVCLWLSNPNIMISVMEHTIKFTKKINKKEEEEKKLN